MRLEEWLLAILLVLLLGSQAVWIFLDARKRGETYWLWGIYGMTNVPSALIVYLLVTRNRKVTCPDCGQSFAKKHRSCPHCGGAVITCPGCGEKVPVHWAHCPRCFRRLR